MGAERGAPAAAMRRAAAVREMESRASLEPYRQKAAGNGKRTVASRCAEAWLGGRLALAATSSLKRRLLAGVEAVAMFALSEASRGVQEEKGQMVASLLGLLASLRSR